MPVSAEIERLQRELDRLYDRLDQYEEDTTDIVTSAYVASLRDAIDAIEAKLDEIETDEDGRFEADTEAVSQARLETLQGVEASEEIWGSWQDRLKEVEGQVLESYELAGDIDGADYSLTDLDAKVLQSLRGQWPDSDTPMGSGLAGRFYNLSAHHRRKLADAVTRQVLGHASPDELRKELQEELDIAERQARQQIRDATIQHSRQVNAQKADEHDFEFFRYRGPLDGITRPFCERLLEEGEVYSRDEIAEMNNGQTGKGSVFVAAGGYNCRHRWLMVRKRWFTDEEWAEMRGDPAAVEEFQDDEEDESEGDE